ncbi:17457_t:CDS:2 [Entrophospora sp. SA101]|nr:17457_t:CDS:2 [Entrophospora sp. SA101]CAJ0845610.1 11133_t:CDS:2 [Entrophospora sp. SA101]CAJ0886668.1 6225_t:CDS:2 [Entrophospora sp. SA101]
MNLLNEILQFSKLLTSANGNDVFSWDSKHLNFVIRYARTIETKLFGLSREKTDLIQQQLDNGMTRIIKKQKPPPSLEELRNARCLLYKALISNPKLSNNLYSYLLKTYGFNDDNERNSSSKKDIITKASGITNTFLECLDDIKINHNLVETKDISTTTICNEYIRIITKNNLIDSRTIKYDYSFKLSPINIKRCTAGRILLKNCLKLYNNSSTSNGYNGYIHCDLRKEVENQIINYLNNYVGEESGGMEIVFRSTILAFEDNQFYRDDDHGYVNNLNLLGLRQLFLRWIMTCIFSNQNQKNGTKMTDIESEIWILHPWILEKISQYHEPFFKFYYGRLIHCTREEQQRMMILEDERTFNHSIQPLMYYRKIIKKYDSDKDDDDTFYISTTTNSTNTAIIKTNDNMETSSQRTRIHDNDEHLDSIMNE